MGAGALIALLAFVFLYFASMAISETYLTRRGFALDQRQLRILTVWIRSVCMAASAVVFVAVFLFLIGQKISYLLFIISGVEALRQRELDFEISVKGNDELTELAESINYLSLSQREINQKEQRLKEERETLIRSLSHDIRTPLTSILSYTEYMEGKKTLPLHGKDEGGTDEGADRPTSGEAGKKEGKNRKWASADGTAGSGVGRGTGR